MHIKRDANERERRLTKFFSWSITNTLLKNVLHIKNEKWTRLFPKRYRQLCLSLVTRPFQESPTWI
jgi:hypothetical protein